MKRTTRLYCRREQPDAPSQILSGSSEPERTRKQLWEEEFDMFDQMNLALIVSKTSPEELAMKFRKREEEGLKEREASRAKVLEWMRGTC
jgi:hypothetical protein